VTAPAQPLLDDDPSPTAPVPVQLEAAEDVPEPNPEHQIGSLLPRKSDGSCFEFDEFVEAGPPLLPQITLDLTYTPRVHYTQATKGEAVTFRLPPNLIQMIDRIIASKATPYHTKSEFFRDAAYYLAKGMSEMFDASDARLHNLLALATADAEAEFGARYRENKLRWEHNVTESLLNVIEQGNFSEAFRLLRQYESEVQRFTITAWRADYRRVLNNNPLVQQLRAHEARVTTHPAKVS
jgi:Arc/MetJ-type ribon-helix-helix transcriptional regulator